MYAGGYALLEWASQITQSDWFDAYCNKSEDFYLKYSIDFYSIPKIEKLFQRIM